MSLVRAALAYAASGLHVLPIRPGAKTPLTEHGVHDASADEAQIRSWWGRCPNAGVGIACGPSRLLVVDLDGPQAVEAWRALLAEHGDRATTATVRTARGWHCWYRLPGDVELGNSVGRLGPKIDTRGAGGYVIAPPSVHPSGAVYTWREPRLPVREAPAWLVSALCDRPVVPSERPPAPPLSTANVRGHKYLSAAVQGELQRVLDAQPGVRNDTLCRAAFSLGQLVGAGALDEAAVVEALTAAASAVGLGPVEADRTLRSGLHAGTKNPRSVTA